MFISFIKNTDNIIFVVSILNNTLKTSKSIHVCTATDRIMLQAKQYDNLFEHHQEIIIILLNIF